MTIMRVGARPHPQNSCPKLTRKNFNNLYNMFIYYRPTQLPTASDGGREWPRLSRGDSTPDATAVTI